MMCPFLKPNRERKSVVKRFNLIGWCKLRKASVTPDYCKTKCEEATDVKCDGCNKSYKTTELVGGTTWQYHDGKHNRYPMLCKSCRDNWKNIKQRLEMKHRPSKGLAGFRR